MLLLLDAQLAEAEDVLVIRPGIGCVSAMALAALTMHGGDSRTHRASPSVSDIQTARQGQCHDLVVGQGLNVLRAFKNTAVVTVHGGQGRGYGVFIVPTIDLKSNTYASSHIPAKSDILRPMLIQHDRQAFSHAIGMSLHEIQTKYPKAECIATGCDFGPSSGPQELCPAATRCRNLSLFVENGVVIGYNADLDQDDWLRSLDLTKSILGPPKLKTYMPDRQHEFRSDFFVWTSSDMEVSYVADSGSAGSGSLLDTHSILVSPPGE